MWLEPKYYPVRIAVLVTIAVMLSLFVISGHAQDARTKTFPIGKEFPAGVTICKDKSDAILASVNDDGMVFHSFVILGKCIAARVLVKYLKLVQRGVPYNVYEVEIDGGTFYAITDWRAEEI